MTRLWRCYNPRCSDKPSVPGHDFIAAEPVCDRCSVDRRDGRFGHLIAPVSIIHFDPPHPAVDNAGVGRLACQPDKPVMGGMASGVTDAVNCPACRATDAWRTAHRSSEVRPEDDLTLLMDLVRQRTQVEA